MLFKLTLCFRDRRQPRDGCRCEKAHHGGAAAACHCPVASWRTHSRRAGSILERVARTAILMQAEPSLPHKVEDHHI
jgi:hypothetical protein